MISYRTVRILRILYNSLFVVGVYEVLEAHILSVGANLPCTDPTTISIDISSSDDNLSGLHNQVVLDMGYLPNIAPAGSGVLIEENKVHCTTLHYIFPSSCYAFCVVVTSLSLLCKASARVDWRQPPESFCLSFFK